ncbi:MAG TPA: hypothetical protein VFR95_11790 [Gemmatimonadaceae bacterium]|nr:hypothetical protein [Gemmatimonadaceae bacterium]
MTSRLLRFGLAVAAVLAVTACKDPFEVKASAEVFEDTLAVYALSAVPPEAPTALNTFDGIAVRTDPTQHFDLVFDIRVDSATGDTSAFILPPRAVGGFSTAGIRKDTRAFDEIERAPTNGYNDSTAVPIKAGDVLLVQAASYACAGQLISARLFIYSKIEIDSIKASPPFDPETNPAGSTIHFRLRSNPNCGFVSFADGIPGV